MKTRAHPETFASYPQVWRTAIETLEALQDDFRARSLLSRSWSDKQFTAGSKMPASTWNMLRSGKHPVSTSAEGIASMLARLDSLEAVCREIELRAEKHALSSAAPSSILGYVRDVNTEAALASLEKCRARAADSSEERLIVIRAATGAGKTALRKWLVVEGYVHYVVTARPSWRRSYISFLRKLADSLSLDVSAVRSSSTIEELIIGKAATLAAVFWFEEVQALCKESQEFIKTLLNDTLITVVMGMTPDDYTQMSIRAGSAFEQLFRRAAGSWEMAAADRDYLLSYAPEVWAAADPLSIDRVLAEAASFGGRALIKDVTDRMRSRPISTAAVEDALEAYRDNVPDLRTARRTFGHKTAA